LQEKGGASQSSQGSFSSGSWQLSEPMSTQRHAKKCATMQTLVKRPARE